MKYDRLFFNLQDTPGPAGYEHEVGARWRAIARDITEKVSVDSRGNSTATVSPVYTPHNSVYATPLYRGLVLEAHIDEIGFVITHIDENGFLYFGLVGGWDLRPLVGQRVRIVNQKGEDLSGHVGSMPIHLMTDEEAKAPLKLEDLYIDIGMATKEAVEANVAIGDYGIVEGKAHYRSDRRMVGRALDNRLGTFVILEVLRNLAESVSDLPTPVTAFASTTEENLTQAGSGAGLIGGHVDAAIVVDVCPATDQPGIDKKKYGDFALGSGPSIVTGSFVNRHLYRSLQKVAKENDIKHTVQPIVGLSYTSGDELNKVPAHRPGGIPTAVVLIPLRYLHTTNEMVDPNDVVATIQLLTAFARQFGDEERGKLTVRF